MFLVLSSTPLWSEQPQTNIMWPFNYREVIVTDNPKFTANKSAYVVEKVHQFLSSSNFLKHILTDKKVINEGIQAV